MTSKVNNNIGVIFAIDHQTGLPYKCIMHCNGFEVEKTKERTLHGRQDYMKIISILKELQFNYSIVRVNVDPSIWEQKRPLLIEACEKLAEKIENKQKENN